MKIEDVEGIGPAYAETLAARRASRRPTTCSRRGASPHDREKIAEATGISSKLILRVGRQRRPDARPGCRAAVQRPARGRRRRLARRTRPAEPGQPRDHRPGSRRRTTGHRPPDRRARPRSRPGSRRRASSTRSSSTRIVRDLHTNAGWAMPLADPCQFATDVRRSRRGSTAPPASGRSGARGDQPVVSSPATTSHPGS